MEGWRDGYLHRWIIRYIGRKLDRRIAVWEDKNDGKIQLGR
jgi:hypothetical protein